MTDGSSPDPKLNRKVICVEVADGAAERNRIIHTIEIESPADYPTDKAGSTIQSAWIAVNDVDGISFGRPPTDWPGELQGLSATFACAASEVDGTKLTLRERAAKNLDLIHLPQETILDCCITACAWSETQIKRVRGLGDKIGSEIHCRNYVAIPINSRVSRRRIIIQIDMLPLIAANHVRGAVKITIHYHRVPEIGIKCPRHYGTTDSMVNPEMDARKAVRLSVFENRTGRI